MVEEKRLLTFAELRVLSVLKIARQGITFILLLGKLRTAQRGDITYLRSHSYKISSPVPWTFLPKPWPPLRKLTLRYKEIHDDQRG